MIVTESTMVNFRVVSVGVRFKHVNKFNHFLFTVWKLECFLTTNKRGEHSLQMWVWDTKEHCVRAHKIIVRALKMGDLEKGKGILNWSLLYSTVGKGHPKKSNGDYFPVKQIC